MPNLFSEGSITGLFRRIRNGEREAFDALFPRLFKALLYSLNRRARRMPTAAVDAEDIVVDALNEVYQLAISGRLDHLSNRHDLNAFSHSVLYFKFKMLLRKTYRKKHGSGKVLTNAEMDQPLVTKLTSGIETSVDSSIVIVDYIDWVRKQFHGTQQLLVVDAMLENKTCAQIAALLGCSPSTASRKVHQVREAITRIEKPQSR